MYLGDKTTDAKLSGLDVDQLLSGINLAEQNLTALGSLTQGTDPRDTITETTSPTSFTYSADGGRDIHIQTDVTIANSTTASVTESVTVKLYDGVDTTGTVILKEGISVTVAANSSKVVTFIATEHELDNGDYHIDISTSGTTLAINQTDEHTKGATLTLGQNATGDVYLRDQDGVDRLRVNSVGPIEFEDTGVKFDGYGDIAGYRAAVEIGPRNLTSSLKLTLNNGNGNHVTLANVDGQASFGQGVRIGGTPRASNTDLTIADTSADMPQLELRGSNTSPVMQNNSGNIRFWTDDGTASFTKIFEIAQGGPIKAHTNLDMGGNKINISPDADFMHLTPGAKGNFTLRYDTDYFRFWNGGTNGSGNVLVLRHNGHIDAHESLDMNNNGVYRANYLDMRATGDSNVGDSHARFTQANGSGTVGADGDVVVWSNDTGTGGDKSAILYDYSADSVSSERFKTNIRPLHRDAEQFLDVEAKTWESDDENQTTAFGFLAEDLHDVFPEAVITKTAEEDDTWIDEDYLDRHGYDWGDEVPHQPRKMPLIAAHHEILRTYRDRIEELEQQVAELQAS